MNLVLEADYALCRPNADIVRRRLTLRPAGRIRESDGAAPAGATFGGPLAISRKVSSERSEPPARQAGPGDALADQKLLEVRDPERAALKAAVVDVRSHRSDGP